MSEESVIMPTPEQAEKLRKFLEERGAAEQDTVPLMAEDSEGSPDAPEPLPVSEEDPLFKTPSVSNIMSETLADTDIAERVTDEDKETYLRAVLHEKPVVLLIPVLNDTEIKIRSKTTFEQEMVFRVAQAEQEEQKLDFSSAIFNLQRFSACLQVLQVGSEEFSDLKLEVGSTFEECQELLRGARLLLFDNMSVPRWTVILNALRVYEGKIATLGTSVLQSNFWNPED